MKRKEFIKSLIGLPLLGLLGFDKKQELKPGHKNLVDGGFSCDNTHITTLTYPKPDPSLLKELERMPKEKTWLIDGSNDTSGWKVYELK